MDIKNSKGDNTFFPNKHGYKFGPNTPIQMVK